jgi:hypothetical protein
MKTKILTLFLIALCILPSCTDNQMARKFGGKEEIKLNPSEELINVTWKESNMWILTKDKTTGIYHFREYSNWGVFQGEVIIK